MKQNVGSTDKAIRVILGLLIIAAGIFYQSWIGLIGIIPIFTAVTGWCPLYSVLGVCSNKCHKEAPQM